MKCNIHLKRALHVNPHPVLWGPPGPRKDRNRHPTLKKSDLPKSFHNVLCNDLKTRLTQNSCRGPRGPQRTRFSCNFFTTG